MLNVDTIEFGIALIRIGFEIEQVAAHGLGVDIDHRRLVEGAVGRQPVGAVFEVKLAVHDQEAVADGEVLLADGDIDGVFAQGLEQAA